MEVGKPQTADRKIIVGVDFGTTYSGVAWAENRNPSRRTCITQWPVSSANKEGQSSDKVPTRIRYNGDKIEWGFSVPVNAPQHEVVDWFKLDLDPSTQAVGYNPSTEGARSGRNVDELVTDFISQLVDHLMYTLLVVDAGGGTVDLISYTILSTKPILEVQEAAPGSGALCGSTFLNMRFSKFLQSKLGKEEGFDDEIMAEALDVFENKVKCQFALNVEPDETYNIPVAGLANNKSLGISRGRFALKASDVNKIFEPVVLEVIRLVKDQITASNVPVQAILLVGGFGSSNYLKERLRAAIDGSVRIMQPPNAWQAIVQGAVLKGLAQSSPDCAVVKVENRKARKHYGTEWSVRWDEKSHGNLKSERYWCGLDGCYKVRVMEWFITRGSTVSENNPYIAAFVWTNPVSKGRIRKVKMTIYNDHLSRDAPLSRNDNVKMLSIVEADVNHIPENQLRRRKGCDDQWYYELNCKIEAIYTSASTSYTLIYQTL
ncbi:hypothetical protein BFJ68_g15532 [Fusarium oxysporum]|uniref:Hsp70 protein n=1 Tax=Fusarium oxysporum TaxID=5507 RepID=A0A420PM15_FUSOX|nr:hypothetical protein BFJ68_g15532 [Fusarium oxysporum]